MTKTFSALALMSVASASSYYAGCKDNWLKPSYSGSRKVPQKISGAAAIVTRATTGEANIEAWVFAEKAELSTAYSIEIIGPVESYDYRSYCRFTNTDKEGFVTWAIPGGAGTTSTAVGDFNKAFTLTAGVFNSWDPATKTATEWESWTTDVSQGKVWAVFKDTTTNPIVGCCKLS